MSGPRLFKSASAVSPTTPPPQVPIKNTLRVSNQGKFQESDYNILPLQKWKNLLFQRSNTTDPNSESKSIQHIPAEYVVRTGYLKKRGTWRRNWKTRYLIIRRDRPSLSYFKSEDQLRLLGSLSLRNVKHIQVRDESFEGHAPYRFKVWNDTHELLLEADSRQEQIDWIQAIKGVAHNENASSFSWEHPIDHDFSLISAVSPFRSSGELQQSSPEIFHPPDHQPQTVLHFVVELQLREWPAERSKENDHAFQVSMRGITVDGKWEEIDQTEVLRIESMKHSPDPLKHSFTVALGIDTAQHKQISFHLYYGCPATISDLRSEVTMTAFLDTFGLTSSTSAPIHLPLQQYMTNSRGVTLGKGIFGLNAIALNLQRIDENNEYITGLGRLATLRYYHIPGPTTSFCIGESLIASADTFHIPIAYLNYRIREIWCRASEISRDGTGISKREDLKVCHETMEEYESCVAFYREQLQLFHDEGQPVRFKKSILKKDKRWRFICTNLYNQVLEANANSARAVWNTITFGCPAAISMGFHSGGAGRIDEQVAELQSPVSSTLAKRHDIIRSQILSAAIVSLMSTVKLAAEKSFEHRRSLRLIAQVGYLLSVESLLSTQGNEGGMIEDVEAAVQWLNRVSFRFVVAEYVNVSPYLIERSQKTDLACVSVQLPETLFQLLPNRLRLGSENRFYAVLFTQGINEKQTLANAMKNTKIQQHINQRSLRTLETYFLFYAEIVLRHEAPAVAEDINQQFQALFKLVNSQKSNKKNVSILLSTSDFCRRLGGGRLTCCKSGKDRTAMSVTLEQARILSRYIETLPAREICDLMRLYGVRRDNVQMNTNDNTYAFNSLQHRMLPECYKPPKGTYKNGKA